MLSLETAGLQRPVRASEIRRSVASRANFSALGLATWSQVMPSYFFHLCRAGSRLTDDKGQTLRDPDQAWETAKAVALDLMKGAPSDEAPWSSYHFEVTDEAGEVVLEFPFAEAVETKGQPS